MRLICPNCDAEYEVEASVIPPTGRDVQCSNCGHSWFQMSPEIEAEAEAEAALYDDAPGPVAGAFAAPAAKAAAPEAVVPATSVATAAETRTPEQAPELAQPEPAPPVARSLDETVLAVLREEAEREAAARKAETTGRTPVVETQTEMGLQGTAGSVAGAAARRVARLKGVDPDAPPPAPPRPQTRRDLLPEIDEINSSLRAASEKRSGESGAVAATMPPPVDSGRRSFRTGFVLMLVVVVIGVAAYFMAPKIVQRIPGAAPAMAGYVSAVDSARLRLDASLQGLIAALRSMTGDEG